MVKVRVVMIFMIFILFGCTEQIVKPGKYDTCTVTETRDTTDSNGNVVTEIIFHEFENVRV